MPNLAEAAAPVVTPLGDAIGQGVGSTRDLLVGMSEAVSASMKDMSSAVLGPPAAEPPLVAAAR